MSNVIGKEVSTRGIPVDIEDGGALQEKALTDTDSDPYHKVRLFSEDGLPSLQHSIDKMFDYVSEKAAQVGCPIKRNRGKPGGPGTADVNMLSVEEKAIIILSMAIGVPLSDAKKRINTLREERTIDPITRPPNSLYNCGLRHREIISAIQRDVLRGLESFSPLVSGHERLVWRARLLQFYRGQLFRVSSLPEDHVMGYAKDGVEIHITEEWRAAEIARLDRSMRPHMDYFDKIGVSPDLSSLMGTPADRLEEMVIEDQRRAIQVLFEAGEITDIERIDRLRALKSTE